VANCAGGGSEPCYGFGLASSSVLPLTCPDCFGSDRRPGRDYVTGDAETCLERSYRYLPVASGLAPSADFWQDDVGSSLDEGTDRRAAVSGHG
jgi:hypothetical protein